MIFHEYQFFLNKIHVKANEANEANFAFMFEAMMQESKD